MKCNFCDFEHRVFNPDTNETDEWLTTLGMMHHARTHHGEVPASENIGQSLNAVGDELRSIRDQLKSLDTRVEAAFLRVRGSHWNRLTILSEVANELLDAGMHDAYTLVSRMISDGNQ